MAPSNAMPNGGQALAIATGNCDDWYVYQQFFDASMSATSMTRGRPAHAIEWRSIPANGSRWSLVGVASSAAADVIERQSRAESIAVSALRICSLPQEFPISKLKRRMNGVAVQTPRRFSFFVSAVLSTRRRESKYLHIINFGKTRKIVKNEERKERVGHFLGFFQQQFVFALFSAPRPFLSSSFSFYFHLSCRTIFHVVSHRGDCPSRFSVFTLNLMAAICCLLFEAVS